MAGPEPSPCIHSYSAVLRRLASGRAGRPEGEGRISFQAFLTQRAGSCLGRPSSAGGVAITIHGAMNRSGRILRLAETFTDQP